MNPENEQQSSYTLAGVYTVDGEVVSSENDEFTSDMTDMSAIFVTNGGSLTLKNPTIITNGNTSSNDASSFYGLNGAVLVNNGSTVSITGGSITTTGSGANGVIPTGEGTVVTLSDMTITASGGGGHGVMATLGGSLILQNVDINTTGRNSAPIATDRGSGNVTVTGGTITSSGIDSPGIYSTGQISVTDAVITSTGTEAAVIEGVNTITLSNTTLTGGVAKTGGVMIYQSFSGDADIGTGTFTMEGGSLTVPEGPVFFVTNTDAIISLNDVVITADSGELVNAAATSRWGTEGSNGGHVAMTADNLDLSGSIIADEISTVIATIQNGSNLSGEVHHAGLIIDSSSTWNVTGDSNLTSLVIPGSISGEEVTNIIGNGYTVVYDPTLQENSPLEGKTYNLQEGGVLTPE
ncbi:hypothetical protein ACKUB1_12380 [Methanospirillum stamsii]|uniref:Uncharacterized protein n=1 Tax=Methanospirillum stamsii TaxID=1277351 RepID=A0A2V2NIW2_9EURY|nr:hypothetical protein [Methanospirillum stamsii]PWR75551.1 hypothetical protein DLD82_04080 [Methanospirillum stamsii]